MFSDSNKEHIVLEFINTPFEIIEKFINENNSDHINYDYVLFLYSFSMKSHFIETIENDFDKKFIDKISYKISLFSKKISLYLSLKKDKKAKIFFDKPILDDTEIEIILKNIIKNDNEEMLCSIFQRISFLYEYEDLFLKSVKYNSIKCCRILSEYIDFDDFDLEEILFESCKKNNVELLEIINEKTEINYNYFIYSCIEGAIESVKFLCEKNEKDLSYYYNTGIFEALKANHFEIADYLFQKFGEKNYLLYRNMCEGHKEAYIYMQRKIDSIQNE
jgi:hypothetical protein